ncbi:MAG: hypothetical protein KGI37_06785, partial [Alphaproteobacteria bacterium]|nr:hypothetical protein [Alphaproteobacteria bacterium]
MEIEKARESVAVRHYEMPTPVFEKNQYALTRKTEEGVVEWATSWGGWSPDMRAGFFRDCAHVVAHRMQQANMAGGEVSEVVTRVYDDTEGNRRFFEGVATDDVIVARRGDDARLVTHNGVLGRGNQISAEAGQAVSADAIIVSPGAEWKQAV